VKITHTSHTNMDHETDKHSAKMILCILRLNDLESDKIVDNCGIVSFLSSRYRFVDLTRFAM
jgi:hypothetical protein